MNGPRSSTARTGFSRKTSRRGEERLRSVVVRSGFFPCVAAGVVSGCVGVADGCGGFGAVVGDGDASGSGVLNLGGARSWPDSVRLPSQMQVAATRKVRKLFIRSAAAFSARSV